MHRADSTIPILKNHFGLDKRNIEQTRKKAIKKLLDVTIIDENQAAEVFACFNNFYLSSANLSMFSFSNSVSTLETLDAV